MDAPCQSTYVLQACWCFLYTHMRGFAARLARWLKQLALSECNRMNLGNYGERIRSHPGRGKSWAGDIDVLAGVIGDPFETSRPFAIQ